MKKTYQQPTITLELVRLQKMIAQSPDAKLNPNATMTNGDFASRSSWYDDDED